MPGQKMSGVSRAPQVSKASEVEKKMLALPGHAQMLSLPAMPLSSFHEKRRLSEVATAF